MELNKYIDHTKLNSNTCVNDIEKLTAEAIKYNFYSVCVNPYYVVLAKHFLQGTDVKVVTVIGFPLGANTTEVKIKETEKAVSDGADEVDLVMNIGAFKSKAYDYVLNEINEICDTAKVPVKVIVETSELDTDELKTVCNLINKSKATFLKTSTGFSSSGAKVEDIKLIRKYLSKDKKIKASGGIRDYASAVAMIEAGADRIGASASVKIVTEINN